MSFLAEKSYRTVMKSLQKASFGTKACKILTFSCNFLILFTHEWHQTFRTLMYMFFRFSTQSRAESYGNYIRNHIFFIQCPYSFFGPQPGPGPNPDQSPRRFVTEPPNLLPVRTCRSSMEHGFVGHLCRL